MNLKINMKNVLQIALIILTGVVLLFLVNKYVLKKQSTSENFDGHILEDDQEPNQCSGNVPEESAEVESEVLPGEQLGSNEIYAPSESEVSAEDDNMYPTDCFPKDKLTPNDLLPGDSDSKWAQVNPSGKGSLKDKNFLEAGFHVGINSVGQSLRNANLQIRSEPPNPQNKVSPWLQSTIEPDTNRKPMEIGGCN